MKEMAGVILYRHKVKILDYRELGKLLDMLWNWNWVQPCLAEKNIAGIWMIMPLKLLMDTEYHLDLQNVLQAWIVICGEIMSSIASFG
jgi:hypothetical protein